MNEFGGGDAAPAVGVVKPSAGRGRGRVKFNAPAPVAASSLTAPPQQQMPVAMVPVPRGSHCKALPQLDAGDYRRQHGETHRDSQMQKFKKEACEEVNTSRYSSRVGISPQSSKPGRQMYRPPAPMTSGSRDQPMRSGQAETANGGGGVSNSVPWNAALGKESLTDMTGCSKCPPLSSGMPAEPPFGQQGQKAVKEIKGAEQPNSSSRKEETDPASPPSDKRSIIAIALTDPDGLNALQMQWLGFSTCNEVTIGSNDAASAVEFCLSVIKKGRTSAFLDGLVQSCDYFFKRREQLLPRCTARTPNATQHPGSPIRSWTAYVTFLAELLAAVSEITSSDENCGRSFCLAALLCDCCLIMLHSPAQDTSAEMQCLRVVVMTAGKSIQRAAPYLSKSLATCLRDSFMDSNRSAGVRQALLELIEFRASGWKLGAAQQLYYSAHDSGAAVTD